MGMKKITPEERLLNLIKKTQSDSIPLELSKEPVISEDQVPVPGQRVRGRLFYWFMASFFILLISVIMVWAFQKNFLFFRGNILPSPIKTAEGYSMSVKTDSPEEKILNSAILPPEDKPSLIKISPPEGYVLTGVIIGDPLSAIIRNTQTEEILTLEIGDNLLQYTVTRIEKGKVTFEDSHNTFTMTL